MATLAIGDIHGEYRVLRKLLAAAKLKSGDNLVLVGDLVGRGAAGADVLRWAADQGSRLTAVLGNHDLHLLWAYYLRQTCTDLTKQKIIEADDARELCDWLRSCPLALSLEHCDALVVHAGVWPAWDLACTVQEAQELSATLAQEDPVPGLEDMHGSEHCRWDAQLAKPQRMQAVANILTRMRTCRADGSADLQYVGLPGEQYRPGSTAWFDYPRRWLQNMRIICGHWSSLGLMLRADVAMLDSGCCFGGTLTGMWVEDRRLVAAGP